MRDLIPWTLLLAGCAIQSEDLDDWSPAESEDAATPTPYGDGGSGTDGADGGGDGGDGTAGTDGSDSSDGEDTLPKPAAIGFAMDGYLAFAGGEISVGQWGGVPSVRVAIVTADYFGDPSAEHGCWLSFYFNNARTTEELSAWSSSDPDATNPWAPAYRTPQVVSDFYTGQLSFNDFIYPPAGCDNLDLTDWPEQSPVATLDGMHFSVGFSAGLSPWLSEAVRPGLLGADASCEDHLFTAYIGIPHPDGSGVSHDLFDWNYGVYQPYDPDAEDELGPCEDLPSVVLTATGVIRLNPLWFEDLPNLDLERLTEAR